VAEKKKSTTQCISEIEKDNACKEHIDKLCIKFKTGHYHLSKDEIGTWAILMVHLLCIKFHVADFMQTHDYPSTTVPPTGLKIGDKKPEPKTPVAKMDPTAQSFVTPTIHTPSMPGPYHPYMYPYHMYPPPPHMPLYTPSRYHSLGGGRYHDIPSSDPPEEVEDVTIFPRISDWLLQLDNSPHGADGHNFVQFAEFFQQHKYFHICDIAESITSQTLVTKCEGMADGTASKIVSYAQADTKSIRRKEEKRTKNSKNHPTYYY